jgi:hypothetical protein
MENQIAEKLKEARALIERGWCQKSFEKDGRYCIEGAVMTLYDSLDTGQYKAVLTALESEIDTVSLISWNDRRGRKQHEVLDLFDRAIAKAEAGG